MPFCIVCLSPLVDTGMQPGRFGEIQFHGASPEKDVLEQPKGLGIASGFLQGAAEDCPRSSEGFDLLPTTSFNVFPAALCITFHSSRVQLVRLEKYACCYLKGSVPSYNEGQSARRNSGIMHNIDRITILILNFENSPHTSSLNTLQSQSHGKSLVPSLCCILRPC